MILSLLRDTCPSILYSILHRPDVITEESRRAWIGVNLPFRALIETIETIMSKSHVSVRNFLNESPSSMEQHGPQTAKQICLS